MIPLQDDSRRPRNFPVATVGIIVLNVVVFILELISGDPFITQFSMVPNDIIHGQNLYTLVSSMFLHAGFLHIAGNMLYLWVFGPNLEDVMGPIPFTIFYFICGLIANAAQIAIDPSSTIPSLGASGAIAGVLGGFILEFPNDQITTLAPIGRAVFRTRLSAIVLLGVWFLLQFFSGVGEITTQTLDQGGTAFFAHIGGFIAGLVLVKLFVALGSGRQAIES
jgi:membrane associated rhomboid family serine protease